MWLILEKNHAKIIEISDMLYERKTWEENSEGRVAVSEWPVRLELLQMNAAKKVNPFWPHVDKSHCGKERQYLA